MSTMVHKLNWGSDAVTVERRAPFDAKLAVRPMLRRGPDRPFGRSRNPANPSTIENVPAARARSSCALADPFVLLHREAPPCVARRPAPWSASRR
ncbi:hypothetical protein BVIET440_30201 [Burkholderia vietnamiensis]